MSLFSSCCVQVLVTTKENLIVKKCLFLNTLGFPLIRAVPLHEATHYAEKDQAVRYASSFLDNLNRKPNQIKSLLGDIEEECMIGITVNQISGDSLLAAKTKPVWSHLSIYDGKELFPYIEETV